jgi:hypothetical protein
MGERNPAKERKKEKRKQKKGFEIGSHLSKRRFLEGGSKSFPFGSRG